MDIKSTVNYSSTSLNCLVYGSSGSGKTYLSRTLPKPLIISVEGGLLSLSDTSLAYVEIRTPQELQEVYQHLVKTHDYESVIIDSLSELGELILIAEKSIQKDGRQAYLMAQDQMVNIIRLFKDLPYHVVMSAKAEKIQDETGKILWGPSMPGQKLGPMLPYFFDLVMAVRVGIAENQIHRALQCQPDGSWIAKDRSGKLDAWEQPDLGLLIKKIYQGNSNHG